MLTKSGAGKGVHWSRAKQENQGPEGELPKKLNLFNIETALYTTIISFLFFFFC